MLTSAAVECTENEKIIVSKQMHENRLATYRTRTMPVPNSNFI